MNFEEMKSKLVDKRIILIVEDLERKTVNEIRKAIASLNLISSDDINLVIDCDGGELEGAFQIVDFINIFPAKTIGLVIGRCFSAAVTVLLGCARRLAAPHATFQIHRAIQDITIKMDEHYEGIINEAKERAHRLERWKNTFYCSRTKLPLEKILELIKEGETYGRRLDAEEAKALGFIDEIIPEDFKLVSSD